MKKIKTIITLTLMLVTGGIVGAYYLSTNVKENVNNAIDKIVGKNIPDKNDLIKLEKVTNIAFDERAQILTFDIVSNAAGYAINVKNLKSQEAFSYNTKENQAVLTAMFAHYEGDVIRFEIRAMGDGVVFSSSDFSTYEHISTFNKDNRYIPIVKYLGIFLDPLTQARIIPVVSSQPVAFNLKGNALTVHGVAKSRAGRLVNFEISFDLFNYQGRLPENVEELSDFSKFFGVISNAKPTSVQLYYADEFVDVTQKLVENGAFTKYTSQGYKIEVLKHEHTDVFDADGQKAIIVKGIYKATHATKGPITFEQDTQIEMDENSEFTNGLEYAQAFLDGVDSKISIEKTNEFEYYLNYHLGKTIEINKKQKEQESDN